MLTASMYQYERSATGAGSNACFLACTISEEDAGPSRGQCRGRPLTALGPAWAQALVQRQPIGRGSCSPSQSLSAARIPELHPHRYSLQSRMCEGNSGHGAGGSPPVRCAECHSSGLGIAQAVLLVSVSVSPFQMHARCEAARGRKRIMSVIGRGLYPRPSRTRLLRACITARNSHRIIMLSSAVARAL